MIQYQYAFIIGIILFLLIWLFFFLLRKDLRKEMLIMSFLATPLGPLSKLFYLRDYWDPTYLFPLFGIGIEDILFAFFIGGIASIIYEFFFSNKSKKVKKGSLLFIGILGIIGVVGMIVFNIILKFNSIYVSSAFFIIIGLIMILKRKDLFKNALLSGLLMIIIMFIFYIIYIGIFPEIVDNFWKVQNISGIFLIGIPIEELIWGFSWGFLCGPFYEFLRGKKEVIKK